MKLFWVILKGFMIIWVFLFATLTALGLTLMEARVSIIVGGITSAIIAGVIVWFIVRTKAQRIVRANPQFRKPPRPRAMG